MGELSLHIVLAMGEHFLVNNYSTTADDHMRYVSLYYKNYTEVYYCYGWNESLRMLSASAVQ